MSPINFAVLATDWAAGGAVGAVGRSGIGGGALLPVASKFPMYFCLFAVSDILCFIGPFEASGADCETGGARNDIGGKFDGGSLAL